MRLAVVTGGSRGLGRALVTLLLEQGRHVVAAARGPAPVLHPRLDWSSLDLSDPAEVAGWAERALSACPVPADAALILNAGAIEPLGPVRALDAADIEQHLRLNLAGPMLTAAGFLRASEGWGVERRVMAISSGAARRGIPHWGAYSAAKAGLDGFVRALAAEPAGPGGPVRAVSIAPGLVDTAMQRTVRTADTPTRARYQAAFERGELDGAEQVAASLLRYLDAAEFGERPTDDIREATARLL